MGSGEDNRMTNREEKNVRVMDRESVQRSISFRLTFGFVLNLIFPF